ncbi:hypothetical protein RO3G_13574 [Rhizopus delemar RA 99-880]|uniref:Uncharacterized protein n=1 Tax=Rhizopus delemar (strain RA 99-880 / ATCC MYA-4621 / FGSC 9543 / NRRL 43880) TaxID=246409 RepID=I1CK83_RHIO9|nr:hypothetical protein RO3G_13574 [Rhizopus delemar RA 99-880]|eukprot:EIE88863.1 hypothetical protein RO3G_13574 [Rhizopus delemar RA 99-880]
MSARIFIECTRHLAISEDETREKIAEPVGLNKSTVATIEKTLQSYVDRLDLKSYRAVHKPRLTAIHRKSVVWSDELRFYVEGSNRGKRVLRKEGEHYDERNIISTVKCGDGGAMV